MELNAGVPMNSVWPGTSNSAAQIPEASCQLISVIKEPQKLWEKPSTHRKGLPKHVIVNKGTSISYKCTICCKTFKSKSNCTYHKHCADGAEKPYSCSICDRKFSSKTHYSYHNLMHSGSNPFNCSQCEKSFKTKNKLLRHEQVHTDKLKKFSCDDCGRLFLRKSSIKVHKRYHTGEKPYRCNECPKAFREKKNLIFHLSRHTGIKNWICEICGKSYSIKWNLELHKRTHTRVRPFQCAVNKCHQSFSQNRYLKRHMETHKNSVKYVCSICDKEFSRKDNLQRHIINTHLEGQNLNLSKNDKSRKLQNTASTYIQTVREAATTNNDESCVEKIAPVVRTESVIKLVTRTGEVTDFGYKARNEEAQHISVIMEKSTLSDEGTDFKCDTTSSEAIFNDDAYYESANQESLAHPAYCDYQPVEERLLENNTLLTATYHYLTNSAIDPVEERLDQTDEVIPSYSNINNEFHNISPVEYSPRVRTEITEAVPKTRCLLPKKIIAASYNEGLHPSFENDDSIRINRRSQDNYKLLDLSMKSQD